MIKLFLWISFFFFSSRRRHTRLVSDWSSDVCSSDLWGPALNQLAAARIAAQPEGLQGCQYLADPIRRSVAYGQLPYGGVQCSGERSAEARVRPSLHLSGTPSPVQCLGAQCI